MLNEQKGHRYMCEIYQCGAEVGTLNVSEALRQR